MFKKKYYITIKKIVIILIIIFSVITVIETFIAGKITAFIKLKIEFIKRKIKNIF